MGSPFAILDKNSISQDSGTQVDRLIGERLTLVSISQCLEISGERVKRLLSTIKPTQGVKKSKIGTGIVYGVTQMGALRILELSKDIPKVQVKDSETTTPEEVKMQMLGFGDFVTLSDSKLTLPLWTQIIRENPTLFQKNRGYGVFIVEESNSDKVLELIRTTTPIRKKIL